jgi:RNase P/RNase MRP subunit p29
MLKNFVFVAPLVLTLTASVASPANAETRKFTGYVTARTQTTLSVYDKEVVTIALDDKTTITEWAHHKPFVRKTKYLSPSAVKVGALITVTTRADAFVADVVQVANHTKTWFKGRVVARTDSSLSLYDKDMAVVTLAFDHRTAFTQLFTVKPWVRATVHLSPNDLQVGSFVNVFPLKGDRNVAGGVEIATGERLFVPPYPATKSGN